MGASSNALVDICLEQVRRATQQLRKEKEMETGKVSDYLEYKRETSGRKKKSPLMPLAREGGGSTACDNKLKRLGS